MTEAIPPGMKLVPIEPTEEMRTAWMRNIYAKFETRYRAMINATPPASRPDEDAPLVPLSGALVIAALRAMDAEACKRGAMFPQTADEQEDDAKAVERVIASLEFYTSERQSRNGWPSVKDWPMLP